MSKISQYDFLCVGSRTDSTFHDNIGYDYFGSLDTADASNFKCSDYGVGIDPTNPRGNSRSQGALIRSTESLRLLKSLESTGLTISVWITPAESEVKHALLPIFAIGKQPDPSYPEGNRPRNRCFRDGYDFRLSQVNSTHLEVAFQSDKQTCLSKKFPLNLNNSDASFGLTQVTISFEEGDSYGTLRIHVNGTDVLGKKLDHDGYLPTRFNGKLRKWSSNDHLELFPEGGNGVFPGSVHRLTMYNYGLHGADFQDSYQRELEELDYLATGLRASITTADAYLPTAQGLPSTLVAKNNRKADVTFVGGEIINAQLSINGTSDMSPSDADGWWALKAKIVSVPKHGILTHDNNTRLHKNGLLDMDWIPEDKVYTVPVQYRFYDPNYFNIPVSTQHASESFQYRISMVDANTGEEFGWSKTIEQNIFVVALNQPTTVDTMGAYFVWGNNTASLEGDIRVVDGNAIEDENLLRVNVKATSGYLSVSGLTEDQEACRIGNRWQCSPSATHQWKVLTFLAKPSQIEDNLNTLQYERAGAGNDTVSITIYDGMGGDCWDLNRTGGQDLVLDDICYNTTAEISVPENEGSTQAASDGSDRKGAHREEVYGVSGVALCLIICALLYGFCECRRFKTRKVKQPPVDDLNSNDIEMGLPEFEA